MENLLQSVIKDRKAEEAAKLNAVKVVERLFNELLDRERDILVRRFGLNGHESETLEEIGQAHNLTRERVRQIESSSIKKIKKLESLEGQVEIIKDSVSRLLGEHGGLMERNFLLDILAVLSINAGALSDSDREAYKKHCDFIISELLQDDIEKVNKSEKFNSFYKLKGHPVEHMEEVISELTEKISKLNKTLTTEEMISILQELGAYVQHSEKLAGNNALDLKDIFKDNVFPEWADLMDGNKVLYSLLQAAKSINQNRFGHWGLDEWPEVKPKKISDKIYLILKNHGEPLHFTEITEKINSIGFDGKKANPGTVHNELILDDRYILVDRGRYGLREWNTTE
jgi:hypothetical protein